MMQARSNATSAQKHTLHRRPPAFSTPQPEPKGQSAASQNSAAAPATAKDALYGLFLSAAAYVLSATPLLFSVNPLGMALLCATDGYVLWIFFGAVLGVWHSSAHPIPYLVALTLALLLRILISLARPAPNNSDLSPNQRLRVGLKSAAARLGELGRYWKSSNLQAQEGSPSGAPPLALRPWIATDTLSRRVLIAIATSTIPCLILPALGGFALYDLWGSVFYLIALLPATVLLCFGLRWAGNALALPSFRSDKIGPFGPLGAAALLCALAYTGRSFHLLGLSPVICLTICLCLILTRRHSPLASLAVAVLSGLAYDVRTLVPYLALVALDALLCPLVGRLSLIPALLAALSYSVLRGGSDMLAALAPSMLVGVLSFSCLYKSALLGKDATNESLPDSLSEQQQLELQLICEQSRNEALLGRISGIAGAMSSLSEVFRQWNDAMSYPDVGEIRAICDEALDAYCPDCPNRRLCWSEDYAASATAILALCRTLARDPTAVSKATLGSALGERCPYKQQILSSVGDSVLLRARERLALSDRNRSCQAFDNTCAILRDVLREQGTGEEDFSPDPATSQKVLRYFEDHGMHPRHVCVSGRRRLTVQIFGISPAAITVSQGQLREDLGEICHTCLAPPRFEGSGEGTLTMCALPRLRADFVHRCSPASHSPSDQSLNGKRPMCGDTLRAFEDTNGMFYALLCDGMGSGRNAALTSASSAMMLEQLLKRCVSVQSALRILNQYLRSRSDDPADECSSTVDLFSLDLYTGKARFIKSGAACSLVLRQERLFRISSHTVPIGILQAIDAQATPFEVLAGDHILLMSDGLSDAGNASHTVGDTGEEEIDTRLPDDWITEYLSRPTPRSATPSSEQPKKQSPNSTEQDSDSAWIETLFRMAREQGSHDDLSMISIRILEQAPPQAAKDKAKAC